MSQSVSEVGRDVYKGTTAENTAAVTPISINAATGITLPAKPSSGGIPGARPDLLNGPLEAYVSIEGTANSRYTINGVTPTAAIGELLVPSNGIVKLILRGQDIIASFKVIGVAAGNTMTYQFAVSELS